MNSMTYQKIWAFFAICIVLTGCATPTSRLHDFAQSHDFKRSVVDTNGFAHLVYTSHFDKAKNVLHVYLEGDGTPWKYRVVTMPDPTPREPLALRLMAKDAAAAAYVGRPCYNGTAKDEGCDSTFWTSARYSVAVISSMTAVIRGLIEQNGFNEVKLIGHSGGGALAVLIAPRIKEVTHVVTIAGNLNTDAWTSHHGYSPLYTSLNPALQTDLPARIKQWHLVGGRDQVVPPDLVRGFVRAQKNALGIYIEGFSHGCCWESEWPSIARAIGSSASGFLPGRRFKIPEP